jgi:hypothetical protein
MTDLLSFTDVGWLMDGLDRPSPAVRSASLRALVRLPIDRDVRLELARRVEAGIRRLEHGAGEEAEALLDVAPYVATPDVRHRLADLAGQGPTSLRVGALETLGRIGDEAAVPGLAALLRSGDPFRRARAAEHLASIDDAAARAALRASMTDDEAEVRFWAALGLARDGLEPMRSVLDDISGGAPFPPLFGDPHVFLGRLRFVRGWPRQVRAALSTLAEDERFTGVGHDLAGLLRDATSEQPLAPGPGLPDQERVSQAAADLDALVSQIRRTSAPPAGTTPGTKDIIELLEIARGAPDPMVTLELGNRIVMLVDAIGPAFDPDTDAGARVYTEWEERSTVLPQIAWVMARAGARAALAALGRRIIDTTGEIVRERAARAAEDLARGLRSPGPPIFGGGDVADVPPDPGDLADAPRAVPRMRGAAPEPAGEVPPEDARIPPMVGAEPPEFGPLPPGGAPPAGAEPVAPPPPPPGPGDPQPEAPASDTVQLGASAPRTVVPGDEFTARFVAYVKALEPEVRRLLKELGPRDMPVLDVHTAQWRRGTEVRVRLTGRRLEIDPPERTFVWGGSRAIEDFQVFVPDDVRTGVSTSLRFEVSILDVSVATITLPIDIAAERSAERATADAAPAASAFASYSSEDRDRVHDCLNALTSATSMDVFMDVIGLRAGQDWEKRVTEEVGRRPLFLLFWSKAAKASRWVDWEWREALRLRGIDGIQPVPLDPAALAPPPAELKAEHFNSVHVLLRVADQTIRAQREAQTPPPAP